MLAMMYAVDGRVTRLDIVEDGNHTLKSIVLTNILSKQVKLLICEIKGCIYVPNVQVHVNINANAIALFVSIRIAREQNVRRQTVVLV